MKRVGLCGAVVFLLVTSPVLGRTCPSPPGADPALAEIDGELRLRWIDDHLSRTARRTQRWRWAWGVGMVGAGFANLLPLPFVAKENRVDWYTGAATTWVGLLPLMLFPPDVIRDSRTLRAGVTARPGTDDVCGLLSQAESSLARDAANQATSRRWWVHAGNVLFNAGVGLFLGLGYHHWAAGAWNAAGGALIGELIIFTQPTETIAEARRYWRGAQEDFAPLHGPSLGLGGRF